MNEGFGKAQHTECGSRRSQYIGMYRLQPSIQGDNRIPLYHERIEKLPSIRGSRTQRLDPNSSKSYIGNPIVMMSANW